MRPYCGSIHTCLVTTDVEHLFTHTRWPSVCLLWENVYSDPLLNFKLDYLGFLLMSYVYILDINSLLDV